MPELKLPKQTAAGFSSPIVIVDPIKQPYSFLAVGTLSGAETIKLQIFDGETWRDFYQDSDAAPVAVSEFQTKRGIYDCGIYRFYKSVTALDVGIAIDFKNSAKVDPALYV